MDIACKYTLLVMYCILCSSIQAEANSELYIF